jgi:hypothetical protein
MANHIGLYYPFIHFKDDKWLKLAALYWDKMGRIVPETYELHRDSDTVKQLTGELGFIENFNPAEETIHLSETFRALLQTHEKKLRVEYDVSKRGGWLDVPSTKEAAPPESDPKLAYVFFETISPDLQDAFVNTSLALPNRAGDPRWIGMHPELAFVYMSALAEQMAAASQLSPATDETLDHLAVTGCTLERLAHALLSPHNVHVVGPKPTEHEIEVQMATLAFQSVLPKNIADVPIQKIIALRKQHTAEHAAFQQHLHDIVSKMGVLQEIESQDALQAHLKVVYDNQLKPQLDEYEQRLKSLGIDTVVGAFNVHAKLPELITSAAAVAGLTVINPLLAAGGAIAFSVLPVIRDKRKEARDLVHSSPAAYLMNVEEGLGSATLLQRIGQRARQFVFGV